MTSRREYLPYAVIETHFVFADPRFKSLRPSSKLTFLLLWCRAFHTRRQRLPNWYTTSSLHEDTGHDTRTLEKCVSELEQKCLITRDSDGCITVLGVKGKGKIKWKDNGELIDQTPDQTTPSVRGSRKGKWKGKGKGNRKGRKRGSISLDYPEWFEGIWKLYPGSDKSPTYEQCKRLKEAGVDPGILAKAAENFSADPNRDPSYTCHGRTFFGARQNKWKDYVKGPPASNEPKPDDGENPAWMSRESTDENPVKLEDIPAVPDD